MNSIPTIEPSVRSGDWLSRTVSLGSNPAAGITTHDPWLAPPCRYPTPTAIAGPGGSQSNRADP
jgi:hypothetical protein